MLHVETQVEEIRLPGITVRVLMDGPTTGASLSLVELHVLPGGSMPVPHHHVGFDEVLHSLSGKLRMTVAGQTVDVGAGESLLIARGEIHAFANPFEEPARLLCVFTPGVFGAQYFRDVRELLAAGGPPDMKKAAEVMMRHGLVPANKPA